MTGYTRHISILGSKPHLPRKMRNLEQFQLYRLTCAASVVCGCSVWIMPRPIIGAQLGSNDAAQVRGLEPHTSQCLPCTLEILFSRYWYLFEKQTCNSWCCLSVSLLVAMLKNGLMMNDRMTGWVDDWMMEWLDVRKLRRRLTVWYIYVICGSDGCGHRSLTTGDAAVLHWAGLARGSKKQDGEMYHHFVLHQTVDTGPLLHHTHQIHTGV